MSIITYCLLGYGDRSFRQGTKMLLDTDRSSNTEMIGFHGALNPTYAGEISLAKLFHFDTYECAPTGLS
jgi:hypothetical protein